MQEKTIILRPALFWDVNPEEIDLLKNQAFIIERITNRGHWEEFKKMVSYYGREKVKEVLVNARYLDKRSLSFCSFFFDIPQSEFRCYKLAQLNPEHWNY